MNYNCALNANECKTESGHIHGCWTYVVAPHNTNLQQFHSGGLRGIGALRQVGIERPHILGW